LTFFGFPFINKLMAIRRCPYCKAIIDESQKYCNNCGTQLLFPEDEFVEEDIPGEKIVDTEFEDKDEAQTPLDFQDEGIEKEEIDLEEVLEGGASLPGEKGEEKAEEEPQPVTYEVQEAPEKPAEQLVKELEEGAAKKEGVLSEADEELAPATIELEEVPEKAKRESRKPPVEPQEEKREADIIAERQAEGKSPLDEQEEIARIIAALERKQKEEESLKSQEKFIEPLKEKISAGTARDTEQELPSWVPGAGAALPSEPLEGQKEKEEETSYAPGDTYEFKEEVLRHAEQYASPHTGMGIPETVTHSLPLVEEAVAEAEEGEAVETAAAETELPRAEETSQLPLGIFPRLKAILFDLFFILIIWAVSLVLASRIMSAPILKLVSASAGSLVLFYLVLLVAYFFLFLFFLGETLGDRVVSAKD
jgi:hypothetical protein